ncbi:MAG: trypsin-like peptidase domain-containing protein [Acidobacteria bacterium]|nr:trypsin-like peptidase domain-containing protein [Acidobacteriota bacterium]
MPVEADARLRALRAEVVAMRQTQTARPFGTTGTIPETASLPASPQLRAEIIEDVKRQLREEMGLLPLQLLRARKDSFVELYAYDNLGKSSYGTAGYLGSGYFITVKHGVVALSDPAEEGSNGRSSSRQIVSVKVMYGKQALNARVVDVGEAQSEVDPGDWAIIKVHEPIDLPALSVKPGYAFDFADPIFRLGNDYSKGIILATGYVGQRTSNGLVTCLTDGHPGVSGGGVLDRDGQLVGIPVGRMQGDFRFSFILPLRREMFRRVPDLVTAN